MGATMSTEIEKNPSSFFSRQERIEWWNQKKLSEAKVFVVGAGALGNEVIKNLSLLGIGHMFVVDFDFIEDSNLSRAVLFREGDVKDGLSKSEVVVRRAKELNPNKQATYKNLHGDVVSDVGLGVYRHADIILGCLDNIEARLSVNLNSWKMGKTWIDGGMWELAGTVSVYEPNMEKACYECSMTREHYDTASKRYSCANSIMRTKIKQGFEPTTQTTSAIIGAIQSQEAVKILHNLTSFSGRRLMFNGSPHNYFEDNNPIYLIDLSVNSDCLCHQEKNNFHSILEFSELTNKTKILDLFDFVHQKIDNRNITLHLGCEFVVSFTCPHCEKTTSINRPKHKVRDVDIVCMSCEVICLTCGSKNIGTPDCNNCGEGDVYKPRLTTFSQIIEDSDLYLNYKDYSLKDLGIPLLQILRITIESQDYFIEITGDISRIWE